MLLALGMENGAPVGDDLAQLQRFHARGVRYITLAHSESNRISDSSYDPHRQWKGLSPFGRKVVAEMNRLGIMVDVSHLSDDAVRQAVELSRVPVIASHSGFRHFTPGFERNLSDELAKAIAARGGVVQVTFGSAFVNPQMAADTVAEFQAEAALDERNAAARAAGKPEEDVAAFNAEWKRTHPPRATRIEAVLEQIDYGVKLVGIDHIGWVRISTACPATCPRACAASPTIPTWSPACRSAVTATTTSGRSSAATCCACGRRSRPARRSTERALHRNGGGKPWRRGLSRACAAARCNSLRRDRTG